MRPELQDIVDEAARILRADTTLEDRDFNLVAYGTQRFDVDSVRRDSILQRRSSRAVRDWFEQFGISASSAPLRTPVDADLGFHARICCPARWRGVTYGYLWALDDHTPLDDPAVVPRRAAGRARRLPTWPNSAGSTATTRTRSPISSHPTRTRSGLAATRIGDRGLIDPRSPVVAVVVGLVGPASPDDKTVPALSPNLWSLPRAVLADRGPTTTTLLVPLRQVTDDDPARTAADLALRLYAEELPEDSTPSAGGGYREPPGRHRRASGQLDRGAGRPPGWRRRCPPCDRWRAGPTWGSTGCWPPCPRPSWPPWCWMPPVRRLLNAQDPDLVQTITRLSGPRRQRAGDGGGAAHSSPDALLPAEQGRDSHRPQPEQRSRPVQAAHRTDAGAVTRVRPTPDHHLRLRRRERRCIRQTRGHS